MAFRGTFDYTLDAKNRLTVPAKFRASLSDGVVLAKGIEPCVALWPPAAYDAYTQSALAGDAPGLRRGRRSSSASSPPTRTTPSSTARAASCSPAFLLDHGGLGKEVVVTGADDRLEVWDRGRWAELQHRARRRRRGHHRAPWAMLGEMALDHVPVLAAELLELLDPRPGEVAVDGTFGGRRSRAPGGRAPRPGRAS